MKAKIKVNASTIIEVEGDSHVELFKEMAGAQEVFAVEKCGCCNNSNLKLVVRSDDDGHDYFEMHCTDFKCRARLPFGQATKPKGNLYPKIRWNSLSDKVGPSGQSEQQKRADEKTYADEHAGFLPNGGWFKFKKETK